MTNLVPEHRIDVTGKVVLRHVRPSSPGLSAGVPLPAPTAEPDTFEKDFAYVKNDLRAHLSTAERAAEGPSDDPHDYYPIEDDSGLDLSEAISSYEVGTALSELAPRTVCHIKDKLEELGTFGGPDYPNIVIYGMSKYRGDSQMINLMTFMYSELNDIYLRGDLYEGETESYSILSDAALGLREYGHLGYAPPEDIFTAADEDQRLAIGLASLRFEVEDRFSKGVSDGRGLGVKPASDPQAKVIVDDDLVRMFLIDPDRVQRLMTERNTADGVVIRSIMEASNPSLSDGIL
jgi:hypothetical protein